MMGTILSRISEIAKDTEITLINRSSYDAMQPLLSGAADILITYPGFLRDDLELSKKKNCFCKDDVPYE